MTFGHPHDMFFSTINTLKYFTHYVADARESYDKLASAVSKVKLETYLSEKMFNVFYNIDEASQGSSGSVYSKKFNREIYLIEQVFNPEVLSWTLYLSLICLFFVTSYLVVSSMVSYFFDWEEIQGVSLNS